MTVTSLLLVCLLSTSLQSSQGNLIQNSSFEEGDFSGDSSTSWNSIPGGGTAITNWMARENGCDWHQAVEFGPAYDGYRMVDLTFYSLIGGVSQTFATTPGTPYRLTFAMAAPHPSMGSPRVINVTVGDVATSFSMPASEPWPLTWQLKTLVFVASSSSTTLTFTGNREQGVGPVIDAISVEPALESASVYVAKTGDDANDGLSWATAKLTVQAGLNAAAAGQQVWVAAGTYVERITLKDGVALFGGFAGNETMLVERDWSANRTILDGNAAGSVVTSPADATGTTRIDGFTIRNGTGTLSTGGLYYGGGIYCPGSSPTIARNTIAGNTTTGLGGGIYHSGNVPVAIVHNAITGNTAPSGGGIYSGNYPPANGSVLIANNVITRNVAKSDGGGIGCSGGGRSVKILNNILAANWAQSGGAISSGGPGTTGYPDTEIANNTIIGNIASDGGGIYCNAYATIANTLIAFNSSGVKCSYTNFTVPPRSNCAYGNAVYNYCPSTADPGETNGNMSVDPKLADVSYGNLHVQPDSPCIDAGDDGAVQLGLCDMDGHIRIIGSHVDIGADESDGTVWPEGPCTIIRVSPEGNDANDGASWDESKRTIQAAIDTAALTGGDVWVKAGTYFERISLQPYVHLYGGFSGAETERKDRDWRTHASILDGQAGGSVVTASRLGYLLSDIDGFTIRNGKATNGGGVHCSYAINVIRNNTVEANTASSGGGGIYCEYASPLVAGSTIRGNTASKNGGGIHCSGSSPMVIDCIIAGNSASGGGGLYWFDGCSPAIVNSTITGNSESSTRGGGGVWAGGPTTSVSPIITNTIIAFNSSGFYRNGGLPALRFNCVYGNGTKNYTGIGDPTGTDGNISLAPGFVRLPSAGADGKWATADDDPGDMHLKAGSPCVDAGDNSVVPTGAPTQTGTCDPFASPFYWQRSAPTGILTDLDGWSRFFNDPATPDTGLGMPPIVDIGAYEYIPGDFDLDGNIDSDDMTVFVACASGATVSHAGDCAKADFDKDGDVDQSDFGFLQRCYSGATAPVDPACTQ